MPASPAPVPRPGDGAPPRWSRPLVYGFLALLLASSALGVEAWPLTGWRLFSQVRTGEVAGWQVVTVDAAGAEAPLDVAALGRAYRGVSWILGDFATMTQAERDEVCRAWVARSGSSGARSVRVYRTRRAVPAGSATPAPLRPRASRVLSYRCVSPS
ncbi:MAG: hypothetical protein ACRDZW_03590 [Acidimicrobiales bacterium]